MVTYLPRSAWGARASRGGVALSAANVVGEALHWPGMAKPINADGTAGQVRVASALRGWQNYHMDDRGWSDIAYQIAIDQAGRAWTLRGLNIRSGANGDATVNLKYGAFLLILAPGEKPSAAMVATTRAVILDFRKRFPNARLKPYGHRDVRPAGTDCPGPIAYADIQAGVFTPSTATSGGTVKPPTTTVGAKMTFEQFKAYLALLYGPNGTEGVWNRIINGKLDLIINTLARIEDDTDSTPAALAAMKKELDELNAMHVPALPDPKA